MLDDGAVGELLGSVPRGAIVILESLLPVLAHERHLVEIDHGFAERTTFIVTPDGKVADTIGGMSPMENVRKSLEAVQKLQ